VGILALGDVISRTLNAWIHMGAKDEDRKDVERVTIAPVESSSIRALRAFIRSDVVGRRRRESRGPGAPLDA
jgi:hypothetical protein